MPDPGRTGPPPLPEGESPSGLGPSGLGPSRSSARRGSRSLGMLTICVAVIAVASVVEVSPERAHIRGVEGPPCLVRGILGDDACPGCGLTRSTAFVLQGGWRSAWAIHPGGFVIALLCVLGVPLHFQEWRRSQSAGGKRRPERIRWALLTRWAILGGVVAPWLWRLLGAE